MKKYNVVFIFCIALGGYFTHLQANPNNRALSGIINVIPPTIPEKFGRFTEPDSHPENPSVTSVQEPTHSSVSATDKVDKIQQQLTSDPAFAPYQESPIVAEQIAVITKIIFNLMTRDSSAGLGIFNASMRSLINQ